METTPHEGHDPRIAALIDAIGQADDLERLVGHARAVRELAFDLLDDSDSAAQLTHTVARLNDALTRRLLDLMAGAHTLAGAPVAWLSLGSEGRGEQTVHTDQDNALIFDDGGAAALRARLPAFADDVNRMLDRCGFPLCKGNVMARNPLWCLSAGQWRDRFADWIDTGDPHALLNATIFFDFRGLWGTPSLAGALRDWLVEYIAPRPLFLRQMTQNALLAHPPLGWFGRLRFQDHAPVGASFDIKIQGAGLFVDAARILALSRGVAATGTAGRLRGWARTAEERQRAESWLEAFHTLQTFRLRRQRDCHVRGEPMDNLIPAAALSAFDRRVLLACFAEAKGLRKHIAVEYGLAF